MEDGMVQTCGRSGMGMMRVAVTHVMHCTCGIRALILYIRRRNAISVIVMNEHRTHA